MRGTVHGTLCHPGGVPGVTWHLGVPGWTVRDASAGERAAAAGWCDLTFAGDGEDVLLAGTVEPERFDDLAALLRRSGAALALVLRDDAGGVLAELSLTADDRAAEEAALRARFERDVAALAGLRVLDVTYWDVAYDDSPEPDWDHGDWHHAVLGVELATDGGVVSVTWTDTFHPYGVETSRAPLGLVPDGVRAYPAGEHDLWRARRGPVLGAATHWERLDVGPARTSDGTVVMPATTRHAPFAIRLDFDAGPVWFVAAMPEPSGQPFLGGDEVMVVFGAERMRAIGFPDGTFLTRRP
ncbi:MAG TPA: hypothetical protein VF519_12265 [Mycobacteriales bacterium]|jgi:hypothetical protein